MNSYYVLLILIAMEQDVVRKTSGSKKKKVRFLVSPYSQPLVAMNRSFTTKNLLRCEKYRERSVRAMQGNITLTVVRSRVATKGGLQIIHFKVFLK